MYLVYDMLTKTDWVSCYKTPSILNIIVANAGMCKIYFDYYLGWYGDFLSDITINHNI